jgi:hypothetical protein
MFFSHFHLKNARFSATSTWKMHVFQPLPPEKRTFFSHFHLKNTRFSDTSAQKTHIFQPLSPEKCMYFGGKCTWFLFLPSLFRIVPYTWTKI